MAFGPSTRGMSDSVHTAAESVPVTFAPLAVCAYTAVIAAIGSDAVTCKVTVVVPTKVGGVRKLMVGGWSWSEPPAQLGVAIWPGQKRYASLSAARASAREVTSAATSCVL